jgi:F0F1-type ATP synthase delta subunit
VNTVGMYARALVRLAKKDGFSEHQLALKSFLSLLEASPPLKKALCSSILGRSQRLRLLQEVSRREGLPPLAALFLTQVLQAGLLSDLASIWLRFQELTVKARGGVLVRAVRAKAWDEGAKANVTSLFQARSEPVFFQWLVEPKLIAGFTLTLNGKTYDGSLKGELGRTVRQLARCREALMAKRLVKQMT